MSKFREIKVNSTIIPEMSTTLKIQSKIGVGSVEMATIISMLRDNLDRDATIIKARQDLELLDGHAILFDSNHPRDGHLLVGQQRDGKESFHLKPEVMEWLEYNLKDRYSLVAYQFHTIMYFGDDAEAATLFKMFWQ